MLVSGVRSLTTRGTYNYPQIIAVEFFCSASPIVHPVSNYYYTNTLINGEVGRNTTVKLSKTLCSKLGPGLLELGRLISSSGRSQHVVCHSRSNLISCLDDKVLIGQHLHGYAIKRNALGMVTSVLSFYGTLCS